MFRCNLFVLFCSPEHHPSPLSPTPTPTLSFKVDATYEIPPSWRTESSNDDIDDETALRRSRARRGRRIRERERERGREEPTLRCIFFSFFCMFPFSLFLFFSFLFLTKRNKTKRRTKTDTWRSSCFLTDALYILLEKERVRGKLRFKVPMRLGEGPWHCFISTVSQGNVAATTDTQLWQISFKNPVTDGTNVLGPGLDYLAWKRWEWGKWPPDRCLSIVQRDRCDGCDTTQVPLWPVLMRLLSLPLRRSTLTAWRS